jgi:hypothetical protein
VEILERKGPLTDVELYELIKETHGEAGFGDLNKTLDLDETGNTRQSIRLYSHKRKEKG